MFLHALATANPPVSFTQRECWEAAQRSSLPGRLRERSMILLQKVLLGDNGIERRHFAVADVDRIFDLDADALNRAFATEAPRLAVAALAPALAAARLRPGDLDALLICTCTGYLCPGLTSYVAEQLGLRTDAYLQDLVGLGCGAAIPLLRAAAGVIALHPNARVACVAVEVCSAAFYLDDDPGVIISACLFGDGAAASIWGSQPPASARAWRAHGFDTLHRPADRDCLRFELRHGKLRNLLHRSVPAKAADAVAELFARARPAGPVGSILPHAGGRDVLAALQGALGGPPLEEAAAVLRACGNMSSPSVLFALDRHLARPEPERELWLTSFGAGFAAHAFRLSAAE